MEYIHIIVLALVQGLTEFLPVSSSAHLILVPIITDWPDQGLVFDVAVHVGTLTAVILYFRNELLRMGRDWLISLTGNEMSKDARLAWAVLLANIPVGLVGLIFKDMIAAHLRTAVVIASTTLIFAAFLWWADRQGKGKRSEYSIGVKDILVIGIAQAFALIPGTSRSGVTITAALMMGLSRQAAARFSFLLSIPVIVMAGGAETMEYLKEANIGEMQSLQVAALISGVSAYLCIHFFLKLLERIGMMPFVIYRIVLALFLYMVFA